MYNDQQLYSKTFLKDNFRLKPAPNAPHRGVCKHAGREVKLYAKSDCIPLRKPKTAKMKLHNEMLGINNKLKSRKGKASARANIVLRKDPIYVSFSETHIFVLEVLNSKNKVSFVKKEDAETFVDVLLMTERTVVVYDAFDIKNALMHAGCDDKVNKVDWIEFEDICDESLDVLDESNLSSLGELIRPDIMQRKIVALANYNKALLKEHEELFYKKISA